MKRDDNRTSKNLVTGSTPPPDEVIPAAVSVPFRIYRWGDPCPVCSTGQLDYDGMLNLNCDRCGFSQGGAGGCFS